MINKKLSLCEIHRMLHFLRNFFCVYLEVNKKCYRSQKIDAYKECSRQIYIFIAQGN